MSDSYEAIEERTSDTCASIRDQKKTPSISHLAREFDAPRSRLRAPINGRLSRSSRP